MIYLPHLETDITLACQNSCVACNHLVVPYRHAGTPPATTPAQVESDLGHLAPVLHADKWGALGGEPTLNRALVEILQVVRASGICDEIELWSHGQTLATAEKVHGKKFWESFDTLVVTAYPGKHTPDSLGWITSKCAETGRGLVIKDESASPNFTALLDRDRPTSAPVTQAKFRACWFKTFSRVVNFGYFYTCCTAPHIPQLIQGRPAGSDGIPVAGITKEKLQAYLQRDQPLGACTDCAGRHTGAAVGIPWAEARDLQTWARKSAGEETR